MRSPWCVLVRLLHSETQAVAVTGCIIGRILSFDAREAAARSERPTPMTQETQPRRSKTWPRTALPTIVLDQRRQDGLGCEQVDHGEKCRDADHELAQEDAASGATEQWGQSLRLHG